MRNLTPWKDDDPADQTLESEARRIWTSSKTELTLHPLSGMILGFGLLQPFATLTPAMLPHLPKSPPFPMIQCQHDMIRKWLLLFGRTAASYG
jgi:hypothetical protein